MGKKIFRNFIRVKFVTNCMSAHQTCKCSHFKIFICPGPFLFVLFALKELYFKIRGREGDKEEKEGQEEGVRGEEAEGRKRGAGQVSSPHAVKFHRVSTQEQGGR